MFRYGIFKDKNILGGIALVQAITRIATHFSVAQARSVVCHTRAPCLNRSTDSDAIWHVHLWGSRTNSVRWGPCPPGEGEIWELNLAAKSINMQVAGATVNRKEAIPANAKLLWYLFNENSRTCWYDLQHFLILSTYGNATNLRILITCKCEFQFVTSL